MAFLDETVGCSQLSHNLSLSTGTILSPVRKHHLTPSHNWCDVIYEPSRYLSHMFALLLALLLIWFTYAH